MKVFQNLWRVHPDRFQKQVENSGAPGALIWIVKLAIAKIHLDPLALVPEMFCLPGCSKDSICVRGLV